MAADRPDALAILKACAVFSSLPDAQLRELAALARHESYPNRSLLVANRARPEHLRHVLAGRVDLTLNTEDGRASSLPVGPGKWATWLGCFHDEPIEHEMWSAPGSAYLAFPAAAVRKAVENDAQALRAVIRQIGGTTRLLIGWALASTLFTSEKRVAYALLAIAGGRNAQAAPMRITQEQIGQMGLGTRQRVSRILHVLAEKGLVEVRYGSVTVNSLERLTAFVFGPRDADGRLPPHPGLQVRLSED